MIELSHALMFFLMKGLNRMEVCLPPRETQFCVEQITQIEHFIIGWCNCTENAEQAHL